MCVGINKAGAEIETLGIDGPGCLVGGGKNISFHRRDIAVFNNNSAIFIDAVGEDVDDLSVGYDGVGRYCSFHNAQ